MVVGADGLGGDDQLALREVVHRQRGHAEVDAGLGEQGEGLGPPDRLGAGPEAAQQVPGLLAGLGGAAELVEGDPADELQVAGGAFVAGELAQQQALAAGPDGVLAVAVEVEAVGGLGKGVEGSERTHDVEVAAHRAPCPAVASITDRHKY